MHCAIALLWALLGILHAADFRPPANEMPATRRVGAASFLPGGRAITPLGRQAVTGPGAFGVAVSPDGRYVVTVNSGPNAASVSVLQRNDSHWNMDHHVAKPDDEARENDWRSLFMGVAFYSEREVYASEGNAGRVHGIDVRNGRSRRVFDLNNGSYRDSYTGDLAYDAQRRLLYVADQANFRVAVIDTDKRRVLSSVRVGRLPFAIALSPDGKRLWVTNIGMFEYKALPGAAWQTARDTGLPFPAFGFPSPEAEAGARRTNAAGAGIDVPGLGDPNVPESNSVCVVNVEQPLDPRVVKFIRTGLPAGGQSVGGSSPSGITVTEDRAFVSNSHNDTITVINTSTLETEKEIPLRIPGLESYRGILPLGSLYNKTTGWLLVAEAGINAVGVIDTKRLELIGHVPTAWFPTRLAQHEDMIFAVSAKGYGTGPNASRRGRDAAPLRGAILAFPVPDPAEIPALTKAVFANNGFVARTEVPRALPAAIEHVVIIVKENRTFDEVFGDLEKAANGVVRGIPVLARFGRYGVVNQRSGELQTRLGLRNVNVTPNHHALAQRFAFSDNFYADAEFSLGGHHWLNGAYPNAWTESAAMASRAGRKDFRISTAPGRLSFPYDNSSLHPEELIEAGSLWHHLDRHGVTFRNFGEGFELAGAVLGREMAPTGARVLTNVPMPDILYRNTSRTYPPHNTNIPDQHRATRFIREIEESFVKTGQDLPRLLYVHLAGDHMAPSRPEDGYPFDASFVADNDLALGRVVEYLSHSKWWPKMAIFITEDHAQGGIDHVDSHRTVLLVASPYARSDHVSHLNSSFPGLLKTVYRLLRIPPLNLFDATAASLDDCFTGEPYFTPFKALPVAKELFDPERARAAEAPDTSSAPPRRP